VTNPVPAPERGGTIPTTRRRAQSGLTASAGAATPVAALERYATLWCNWTARTAVAHQRHLARISLGQARAQALQAAATLQTDGTLRQSQVANAGQVVAVTRASSGDRWIVVTQETTTGRGDYAGLPATLHITYAQLTATSHGYVVSTWSPQT
jgi:hypothetical protein